MSIGISAPADGGNIRLVAQAGERCDLEIVNDAHSEFYQWFYFRAAGIAGRRTSYRLINCAGAAYPGGWPGYQARASTDLVEWRTIETSYTDGVLTFHWDGSSDVVWFAYFAPYTMERHQQLVARFAAMPGFIHRELGHSLDGQPIDLFTVGSGAKPVWFYARQHPGESMCEWFMEGLMERLADAADPHTAALLAKATFHCVPNMNPDGTRRGHLRVNAAGINLNREWHAPSMEKSPEVKLVRDAMDASGVVFAMDVHGDEAIPANFFAGFEGIPRWTDEHGERFYTFGRRLAAHTPDFQTEQGYGKSAPGRANLSMSTNQLAERFGAVSMTLEMPFKDHAPNPDPVHGWSPERSKLLAHACLEVLAGMIDEL
jgi:murein tripeptide amidase MpaA